MAIIPKDIRVEMIMNFRPVIDKLSKHVRSLGGIQEYVNDYIYNNSKTDLEKFRKSAVTEIYFRAVKHKSKEYNVDRATISYKRKVNQYTTDFGIYFDYKFHPGIATIIGDKKITVIPRKGHTYLTVPEYNSPAYEEGEWIAKRLSDFHGVKFNPKGKVPYWYLEGEKSKVENRQILFWGKKQVVKRPPISTSNIRGVVEAKLNSAINNLAHRALKKLGGIQIEFLGIENI